MDHFLEQFAERIGYDLNIGDGEVPASARTLLWSIVVWVVVHPSVADVRTFLIISLVGVPKPHADDDANDNCPYLLHIFEDFDKVSLHWM